MWRYILKRIFQFIPSLFILSLVVFGLSRLSPGDPVQNLLEEYQASDKVLSIDQEREIIRNLKNELGLDKPDFYFSLRRRSHVSNYITIDNPNVLQNLNALAYAFGNGEITAKLYQSIISSKSKTAILKTDWEDWTINSFESEKQIRLWKELSASSNKLNNYLPYFKWNGFNNQYHDWISKLLLGDFGKSFYDHKPISEKLGMALPWTITLSLISIILAFGIALPTGIYAAKNQNSKADKFLNRLFFTWYSIPNFWLGSILLVFLTNSEYLNLFPSYGVGEINENDSFIKILQTRISHLVLPVIVWTYGSVAFIFKQVRSAIIQQLSAEYIQTAKAKGLTNKSILWKHAFKNASFPIITIIGALLPAVFSGSFVVEYLFSIPGMGMLTIESFSSRDYPVIFSILMLMGVLTMIGLLIADILYAWNDPRIRIQKGAKS